MTWSNRTNSDDKLRLHNMCWISRLWEALGLNKPHILKSHDNIWHFYFSGFLVKCLNNKRESALNRKRCIFFFCICPIERAEWRLGWNDIYEIEIYTHSCVHAHTHTHMHRVSIYSWANFCRTLLLKQKSDHVTTLPKTFQWLPISPRVKANTLIIAYRASASWCWILPFWPSSVVLGPTHTGSWELIMLLLSQLFVQQW